MAYVFYLDGLQLPITPAALTVKISNKNKTITLINEGEVNLLKAAGLSEVTFSFLLPLYQYPFAEKLQSVETYLNKLETLKTSLQPFQFIVYREKADGTALFKTNMTVSLEDYTIKEDAEQYGMDIAIEVSLKQYRPFGTKVLQLKESSGATTATVTENRDSSKKEANTPTTYTVQAGDSLWKIAKAQLGDGAKWNTLYELNKSSIANPNQIQVGQTVRLR